MIDGVLDSGVIEQLTESNWLSPFPQFQTTERPDKCAAEILNGRILLLCDHSPVGILFPAVFNDFLQVSEDSYNRFEIVSLQRLHNKGTACTVVAEVYSCNIRLFDLNHSK